ncbi:heptaprenyl diphosphate synthase component 1 [Lederbergia lenta]|uniref:Heptaprenyl diphosphate synthase subunit 1 n=1 Tax=Lederbergia lenta TaxID=1467 RepID=A0A2X4WG15_LEDLE|nr:heptaprenyl diphosphate synthase component 1 [Lederbergia lenta]MCM3109271.1 heptaprenyl diphosphate synthase component 1 [Lederbergia lenta]MEC2324964.1 heptaprenyl diphosphate synthase component 1 [Lederbergia lenta]SQI56540.1 Heptaprenyl diphosphate synthase subunit 1 [Lederbergia lenta]
MAVCDYVEQMNAIKELLNKKSYNSYFQKVIGSPQIDEDRLLMMSISLQDTNLTIPEQNIYITSAMLVQLALNTHERVADPDAVRQERQLAVLAGDYYSGMYYHLLAYLENTELITSLATAIKVVNEHNISLFQNTVHTFEEFLNEFKEVEIAVIEQFCLHFQATKYISFFNEFLFLKKMIKEYEGFQAGKSVLFFERLKEHYFQEGTNVPISNLSKDDSEKLSQLSYNYVEESINRLNNMIEDLPVLPPMLQMRIQEVLSRIHGLTRLSVEEG